MKLEWSIMKNRRTNYLSDVYPGDDEYLRMPVAFEVKSVRDEAGLTQKEFAAKIGTSQSAVARIEKGRQNVGIDLLLKIADVFGKKLQIYFN